VETDFNAKNRDFLPPEPKQGSPQVAEKWGTGFAACPPLNPCTLNPEWVLLWLRPLSTPEDKLWLKPYVDLQAYEDPAQGALDFTQELDPGWLTVDTVIGEGEPCCAPQLSMWQHRAASKLLPSAPFSEEPS
jgi:hypothetical protein